jgi:hypothetical protein
MDLRTALCIGWVRQQRALNHLDYAETNQLNEPKLYTSLFFFYYGSYMFRQNNAILRELLFSFLSHFSVNTVGDKSQDI